MQFYIALFDIFAFFFFLSNFKIFFYLNADPNHDNILLICYALAVQSNNGNLYFFNIPIIL